MGTADRGRHRILAGTIGAPGFLALILALGSFGTARSEIPPAEKVRLSGDFRLRFESDWDSRRADGTEREDRTRVRARVRLGVDFQAGESISMGVRLRSGSDLSQQSPHITLFDLDEDHDTGDADFHLDRWYLRARAGAVWGWAGRNGFPFWRQNELFWDDDATVAGLAGGCDWEVGERSDLALHAAYLTLPAGMEGFAPDLAAAQAVYTWSRKETRIVFAGGLFRIRGADPASDPDAALLLDGNGERDYRIWVGSVQARFGKAGIPLTVGADYLHNAQDYSPADPDPFTAAHHDQTGGFVGSIRIGEVAERGDWEVRYDYARIEALAVNASYAQDDWVRWGSAFQTASSDLEGHEFRLTYGFTGKATLVARLYLVEAITSVQDGNRFRVDFNYRF